MLHNPSIETTKEMKRMLFLLKSLSSLLSSLFLLAFFSLSSVVFFRETFRNRILFALELFYSPRRWFRIYAYSVSQWCFVEFACIFFVFLFVFFLEKLFFFFFFRRAREDDISSDGEESNPEVDFARDDDVLLR